MDEQEFLDVVVSVLSENFSEKKAVILKKIAKTILSELKDCGLSLSEEDDFEENYGEVTGEEY
jgi:hypothetical protein